VTVGGDIRKVDAAAVDRIVAWLADGARPMRPPPDIAKTLCDGLLAAGVEIERGMIYIATLHPNVLGRRFVWRRGAEKVQVDVADLKLETNPAFTNAPTAETMRTGRTIRLRLEDPPQPGEYEVYREFREEGFTDYLCQPLPFINGENHVVTWTTKRKGGFTRGEIGAIKAVRTPLARVAEVYALRRTATNLLDTYVGHSAGEKILAGHIRRGDTESIHAAILMVDLRGFTAMADTMPGADVIGLLNEFFGRLVAPIRDHGGEVLKFMGDGLLAIFPTTDGRSEADVCYAAVNAARQARDGLAAYNREREDRGEAPLGVVVTLHVGDILYGNVGGAERLDFTAIGPAVNMAARLEALAKHLDRGFVTSSAVARHAPPGRLVSLGRHELRGFRTPEEVFGLVEEQPAGAPA
jgi:adenylate cyclase